MGPTAQNAPGRAGGTSAMLSLSEVPERAGRPVCARTAGRIQSVQQPTAPPEKPSKEDSPKIRLLCVAAFAALLWALYERRLYIIGRQYAAGQEATVGERLIFSPESKSALMSDLISIVAAEPSYRIRLTPSWRCAMTRRIP